MGDTTEPRSRKALLSAAARACPEKQLSCAEGRPTATACPEPDPDPERSEGEGEAISSTVGPMGKNALFADSCEGFAAFYKHLFNRQLPRHALREWIIPLYKARRRKKGLVVFAFRGSTKTTTLTIAFTAFRIGHQPHMSNLIIQAGDAPAADTAAQIADLIAHHHAWRAAFPTIVPDPRVAWGAGGYEVRDTNYEYETWRARCAQEKGKDPTFVALGYKSRAIIGKHPTGLLVVDDIHDETNTRSARELRTAITILTGTILPTVTPHTWQVFVGTPWRANDALAHIKATNRFISAFTPVYTTAPDSAEGGNSIAPIENISPPESDQPGVGAEPVPSEPLRGDEGFPRPQSDKAQHVAPTLQPVTSDVGLGTSDVGLKTSDEKIPTWPERFPFEEIQNIRQTVGEAEFARMYLLDLKAAEGIHLRREWLNEYPHEKIRPDWPVIIGVDYASTADKLKDDRRDYFAVAIGRALPGGGILLEDGFRDKLTQGEAEETLRRLVADRPYTVIVGIEAVGKGEEFFLMMRRIYGLPWQDLHPAGRSKGDRFEKFMGVEFQYKRVWISDVQTEFLRAFREEWLQWPWGDHDDTLDAVAWMLEAGQQYLLDQPLRKKSDNPLSSLGRN